jgi:hypothetical protein
MGVWVMGVCATGARALVLAAAVAASLFAAASAAAQTPGLPVVPIPTDPGNSSVTPFEGSEASANPADGGPAPPRHPFMAPNGRSNIHDDAYMTDTYGIPGPLGDGAEASTLFARECASVTFDSQGRIVTICVGLDRPVLALLDPHTLETLAAFQLPARTLSSLGNPFTDFSGGGYFFLDHQDHAVLPTNERHVLEVAIAGGPSFALVRDYDLSGSIASGDGIVSVLPDWSGRYWFATRSGLVGTIDRSSGAVQVKRLEGEGISNSFAIDETGGVFIVSDRALYRFDAAPNGAPQVSWREVYPNSGVHKPGQSDAGSGTTPTLMGRDWVAITDNADPMDVVVYRRARTLGTNKGASPDRLVCSQPVFERGGSATDQSLIATDRSIVAENNFGYSGPTATMNGGVTSPGLSRIDVDRRSCRTVWTSQERSPSVVPKLSLANGLVYTYTKPPRPDNLDAWFLTALDFRTGATVYRRLAGTGFGYNNNYAPVSLGPDGTAYVGVLGGLVAFP